jgi:hypothetical protein
MNRAPRIAETLEAVIGASTSIALSEKTKEIIANWFDILPPEG